MDTGLPADAGDWSNEAKLLRLRDKSIHEYDLASSASKIGREQFLLLHIIWLRPHAPAILHNRHRGRWITNDEHFTQARLFFASGEMASAWKAYLNATAMSPGQLSKQGYAGLHTFSLVRYHQIQSQGVTFEGGDTVTKLAFTPVARRTRTQLAIRNEAPTTPTPALGAESSEDVRMFDDSPSTPERSSIAQSPPAGQGDTFSPLHEEIAKQLKAIQDEQIVNTALILYLDAVTIHCPELEADWTLHRVPFISKDYVGNKTYEARVDGYLKRRSDGEPLVILEVKPFLRENKPVEIRMQEGAQMAAWINQHPPPRKRDKAKYRRLLISQDRHEIHLTFASFDDGYVDYICHKNQQNGGPVFHLAMSEYGPYDVGDSVAMGMLGEIVISYALEACRAK
ncbi:hypothetical protein F4824DRAFT_476196 [Ustulina deusta]|nr:hypothetical protein F4824DRAFT_476196 [Ustulina deusta]